MKQSRTKNSSTPKRNQKLSLLKLFFMKKLKGWLDQPDTREGKRSRKDELAKVLGKEVVTIKNMYLYGQGSLDDWFKAMDYINALKQQTIIQLYDSYPYIEEKLSSLSSEQLKLHKHANEMTEDELALLNNLIEAGLKVNKAARKR